MSGPAAPRRCAVLGHPIEHSLSPVLHRAAHRALGLEGWRYDAVDVTEDDLPAFVAALDASWAGLSLTMPLKKTVLGLLDHVEPLAEVVGAVNTVLVQGGGVGRPTLIGANTDVHGIVAAVREGLGSGAGASSGAVPSEVDSGAVVRSAVVRSAVVLGAGATAASTLAALAQLGCPTPQVYVRSMARAGATMRAASRMGVEPRYLTMEPLDRLVRAMAEADVVVSTLPAHAADPIAELFAGAGHTARGVLLDCAYDPRPTALDLTWRAAGGAFVSGERMLLHQATEQVRLMTGRPAPIRAMESALDAALSVVPS